MINSQSFSQCLHNLEKILPPEQIFLDMPMREQTTFTIGGPADCMLCPASLGEIQEIVKLLNEYDMPYLILGNGSNVLVADAGIRGFVIKFNDKMGALRQEGEEIVAGSGTALGDISRFALSCGLTGFEFAIGIPGSIGGAVFMNAGAYGGEMSQVTNSVTAILPNGNLVTYKKGKLGFSYRKSIFQTNHAIIGEIRLSLKKGDPKTIKAMMDDLTKRRESKQPLDMPSAGSTFKRPSGYFAGTLIDQTGLKGLSVGGAQVSLKHAGFIVNKGNATAADVLALIKKVQERVYAAHGVKLQPEVRLVGEYEE